MEKCKVCGRKSKNDSLAIRLLGEKAESICEVCAGKIYSINTTRVKETYDRETMWLNKVLNSEYVDADTKSVLKEIAKERKNELIEIERKREKSFLKIEPQTFWTSAIKFVSICEIFLFVLIGGFLGYSLARFNSDEITYTIIGAVIGGVIGSILLAVNMFIVEVAENIATGISLLAIIAREKK